MAYYLNQFHCIGNLTADPELKDAGKNKVCKFRIAVNNPHNESALYFYVDVWGKEGEKCMMLKKGAQVFITNASILPKQYSKTSESGEEFKCTTFTVNVDGYCGKVQFGPKPETAQSKPNSRSKSEKTKKPKVEDSAKEDAQEDSFSSFEEEFEF